MLYCELTMAKTNIGTAASVNSNVDALKVCVDFTIDNDGKAMGKLRHTLLEHAISIT